MKIILFSIFIFFFSITFSFAGKVSDNYHRALKFYKLGKIKKSTILIKRNISKKKSHLPSLILWSKILIKKNKFSKALKIYFSLIKALHYPISLNLRSQSTLEEGLNNIPSPAKKAREIYYLIAKAYWMSSKSLLYSKKTNKTNLVRALRYFQICNYYEIKPKLTAFHLALIRKKMGFSDLAEVNLSNFSKLTKNDVKRKRMSGQAKLLLGNVYLDSGQYQKGLLLSNSVKEGINPNIEKNLKTKVQKESSNFTVLLGKSFDSNLTMTSNLNNLQKSTYSESQINYNFRTKMISEKSYIFGISFNQETMDQSKLSYYDNRSLQVKIGLFKNNDPKSLLQSTYSFSNTSSKSPTNSNFQSDLNIHTIETNFFSSSSEGMNLWAFSISGYDYINQSDNIDFSITRSFEPFSKTKFFSPTYKVGFYLFKNKFNSSMTPEFNMSLKNRSTISSFKLKVSTHLHYSYQYNKQDPYNLHTISLTNILNIPIFYFDNLYFFPSIKYSLIKKKNNDFFSKWGAGANFSLTF